MKNSTIITKATQLRNIGLSYEAIDNRLNLSRGRTWYLLNPDKVKSNHRDTNERYQMRGCVAITTLAETDPNWWVPQTWRK